MHRDYEETKWDNKGKIQFFVGYTKKIDTFRFFDEKIKRNYESCDTVFLDKEAKSIAREDSIGETLSGEIVHL